MKNSTRVCLRSVQKGDMLFIQQFYRNEEQYHFATGGMNMPVDFYNGLIVCLKKSRKPIGYIRALIYGKNKKILWITNLMISVPFIHKGYGTEVVRILIQKAYAEYQVVEAMVSVAVDNHIACCFWKKLGFIIGRTMDKKMGGKIIKVIIMTKCKKG